MIIRSCGRAGDEVVDEADWDSDSDCDCADDGDDKFEVASFVVVVTVDGGVVNMFDVVRATLGILDIRYLGAVVIGGERGA